MESASVHSAVVESFRRAAASNTEDPRRRGNVIELEEGTEVVLVGDLHGNRRNLARAVSYADLDRNPSRRLILQELIHGPVDPQSGHDRSVDLLLRAARLKISHPLQTLILLTNHDIAQVTGNEITKEDRRVCRDFRAGVRHAFGEGCEEVIEAINEFLLSAPLAVRCPNRVFIVHSLPSPSRAEEAGMEVLQRPYLQDDLHRGGAVYEWTWGRDQTPEQLERLAERLDADFFLLGHRHCPDGYEVIPPCALAVASDHTHGCLVRFSTDETLTLDNFREHIREMVRIE